MMNKIYLVYRKVIKRYEFIIIFEYFNLFYTLCWMQPQRQSHNNLHANQKALERNPSGKLSYSPGHWKNYIATDLIRRPEESRSSYESGNRFSSPGNNSYYVQMAQASQK
jgi:hypothetical protein